MIEHRLEFKSTMDKTRTRTAEFADAENIARLVNVAFRPERFFTDADRTDPAKVQALLRKGKFLLAEEAGMLVGCVYVELRGERGYFGLLAVDPARQHAGVGSSLIEAAEDYCRADGCLVMDLTIVICARNCPDTIDVSDTWKAERCRFPRISIPPRCPATWSGCPNL